MTTRRRFRCIMLRQSFRHAIPVITSATRRLVYRAAAILVACVFLSLPTLVRLHDHLSTADNISGFRLSKNIERPHERHSPPPSVLKAAAPVVAEASSRGDTIGPFVAHVPQSPVAKPASSRAPPR